MSINTTVNGRRLNRKQLAEKIEKLTRVGLVDEAKELQERYDSFNAKHREKKYYLTAPFQDVLRDNKIRAIKALGGKCAHCGVLYPPAAMQFHHTDPTAKLFMVSGNVMRRPWEEIEAELKKCIVLCANCHAILHAVVPWAKGMDAYNE